MQIGLSLAMDVLCDSPSNDAQKALMDNRSTAALLEACGAQGVTSIEIRTLQAKETPERASKAARVIHDAELNITVHGALREGDAAPFFMQLEPVLALQPRAVVTIHPIKRYDSVEENHDATLRTLEAYLTYLHAEKLPVLLALENNRLYETTDPSVIASGVSRVLRELPDEALGACWDFGHQHSDHTVHPDVVPDALPDDVFSSRICHTHIHDMHGRTHFPLGTGDMPLKENVAFLQKRNYAGLYNLEPEPERWFALYPDVWPQYKKSIRLLKEAMNG